MKNLVSIVLLVLFSYNCTAQNIFFEQSSRLSNKQMVENLRQYIEKQISDNNIAGLSFAATDESGILLADGFGQADKAANINAGCNTLFPVGSVTKTFTGIAVMQLVEKGLIDLDKPINEYIPELKLPGSEEKIITTRMLLTHHSGIQGDILYHWYLPSVSKNPLVYEQITDLINETGTIFKPGKLHSYSNAGYALLGVLIHKVSGQNYPDYIRTNIFEPLCMEHSIVYPGEETNDFISKGYFGKQTVSMPMKLGIPAGGAALSANDAAKYMSGIIKSYHGKNTLLEKETIRQMMKVQNKSVVLDQGFDFGLTWFLQDPINEHTVYAAHRGELPPYHAMMIILPELKIGVFVSINTDKASHLPEEAAHKIIYDLYEYHTGKTFELPEKAAKTDLDCEVFKSFAGVYPNVYFGAMALKQKRKNLILRSPVMPMPMKLIPHADSSFSVKLKLFGLIPFSVKQLDALKVDFREYEGEKYMYFNIQNRMLNPNIQIERFEYPDQYKHYEGKYRVMNMKNSDRIVKNVQIKKKGDYFTFKYTFLNRHKFNLLLEPMDTNRAKIAGIGYFTGDKIRWEIGNDKIRMFWSGLILENMN